MNFEDIKALSAAHGHKRPILTAVKVHTIEDEHADLSWLDTDKPDDQERLAAYGRDWWCIGVRVEATVHVPHIGQSLSFHTQSLRSAGLWGIESDSGSEYIDSVARDEWRELVTELEIMNVVIPEDIRQRFECVRMAMPA